MDLRAAEISQVVTHREVVVAVIGRIEFLDGELTEGTLTTARRSDDEDNVIWV
jgi:hypothetical protein